MQHETSSSTTLIQSDKPITADDLADHLPLHLIESEAIPPSPTRSESTIDWLPDFAGYSWVAYGASSLLVISHFPSPVSDSETLIGPIFRQVFELSSDGSGSVSAVSWSPVTPSVGEVAAALDNCIGLFSHNSDVSSGSFCWSQTTVLVQSTKVEAIEWTGSGDGIISVGIKVVLWRKKGTFWEIAWNFRPELPQTLVSATWSIEGHSATAPSCKQNAEGSLSAINTASKCVIVFRSDQKSKYVKAELPHPLPVSMIQWRPSTIKQSVQDIRHPPRLLLLTCCIDGTVRLWSEIDDARVRKVGKDMNDQRTRRSSFHVSSVIEINQAMNGILGSDIHVRWATEINGIFNIGKEASRYFPSEDYQPDGVGKCEWLIGFGPQRLVTLWAIHCLDDIAPMRYPRVTLWKRQELKGPEVGISSLLLRKVIILRNQVFGPPTVCSLVQLLPCNSLAWFHLNSQTSTSTEESLTKSQTENLLSSCTNGTLNIDSHTGKLLQVAVHSHGCESELAASLDTDGLLLLWSVSNISNCIMGLPTLKPTWKLFGKIAVQDTGPIYTSLSWIQAVLDESPILLAGHVRGVDCFVVKFSKNEEAKVFYHKLCTIPFTSHSRAEGPTSVYSVPLPSTHDGTFVSNTSMLLAVWKNTFQALSWKITIHRCDFSGSCGCSFDIRNTAENNGWTFESNFSGQRYYLLVDPWSSVLPDPHNHNEVTSYAVVSPTNVVLSEEQKGSSVSELRDKYSAYHIATGCFDGSLRLWRSMSSTFSNSDSQWELVGVLDAHQGPITTVSASDCGRKIATIAPAAQSKYSSILHVWEAVNVSVAGSFMLEDTIFLDGEVVALNWLTLGNGQLLLGVCLQNQLHVYAQRRCGGQNILNSERSSNRKIWFCVALTHTYPANRDFFWGPKASAVVVHNEYFSLFSPWLLLVNKKSQPQGPSKVCNDSPHDCNALDSLFTTIFSDLDFRDLKESSVEEKDKHYVIRSPCKMNVKNDILSSIYIENFKQNYNSGIKIGFWSMLDVAEKFGGSLPVYHPEALLMNICSGNWKRAQVALKNLVDYVTSENVSSQRCNLAKSGHVIPLVNLSNYLEGCLSSSSSNKTFQWGGDAALITSSLQLQQGPTQFASSWDYDGSSTSFTSPSSSSKLSGLGEPLEKLYDLGAITNSEKMQLLAITDLLHEVSNPHSASVYESLDEPGRRFWVAIRFQKLYFVRRFGRMPSVGELVVDSGLIGWAFHSDCQENLFNSLLPNEPSWHEMRNIGVGFWYTNATQLRLKMEKLARQQYLKNKDPKACALLYIALNRLQVLAGLFKMSKDEKDKPLVGFLSRNFQEDKNKAAALKNAYVLMGRHQLELAVAFFLLGGDTSSAINVCAKNLGDEQLALVICRLVESFGGPLQCHLISKFMLPSAIEKGDNWLASYLEWALGNYSQAFMSMLGFQMDTLSNKPALLSNHDSFLDPSIGEYCLMLATSNSMRNALGERNAAILGRWAILMSATALSKCGLPLEGLERLTSSLSFSGDSDQGNVSDIANSELLNEKLRPSLNTSSSNWISTDVAFHMELHAKLDMAMHYIIKLLREHPSWTDTNKGSPGACTNFGSDIQYQMLLGSFQNKLQAGLAYFEQKFSLVPLHLIEKSVISFCSNGLVFIGYQILLCYTSKDSSQETKNAFGGFLVHPILRKLLLKVTEEMAYLYSRYVIACSISCSHLKSCSTESSMRGENRFNWLAGWQFYVQGLIWSLWSLRSTLKLFSGSNAEDFIRMPFIILDLSEYYVYFASAWLQRNLKGLILLVKPILMTCNNGPANYEINIEDINKLLPEIAQLLAHNLSNDDAQAFVQITKPVQRDQDGNMMALIPIDERWQIIRALLWGHMSGFLKHQLNSSSLTVEDNYANCPPSGLSSFVSDSTRVELDNNNMKTQIGLVFAILTKLIKITCEHISSHCERQLASSLLQKIGNGCSAPTLKWLEEFSQFHPNTHQTPCNQGIDSLNMMNNENELSASEILWHMCADPKIICGGFALNSSKWLQYIKQKPPRRWIEIYRSTEREHEAEENCNREGGNPFSSNGVGSPVKSPPDDNIFLGSGGKDTAITKKVVPFQSPKEICKRNGELLEALCVNSINQQQAAIASNRKGIIFFNQEDVLPSMDGSKYIWSEVDWPHDGWAGSESTPVPTCVSPGVGLGSKKGTHLGLGGATVGVGSLAKLGRDFTDGGAFGVPGYAGAGSSGLGWEIQEEFEEFVDPPATVENIRTRAFSSHPSKPLFLVGSSNTHIYLWEFSKERATATYGVLPAANVPPPYALASISAVRFDHCGQRFATAALDGTVCTWQLEVGGRSNIRPTESSLCFNNYASDVTYVTASGSIIATAGYSSDAVNVVIWDTLAPPTSSRASIMCHEGGARSLSVFDNDIGSGSISPFIVTGGKGGDVGVHDFRYIATGRTKRHKHSGGIEEVVNGSSTTIMHSKIGDQNSNGMLWYIPKAHSGSVTRISAIPNTNFFLTGSKDGDVKLWDAKRAKLVFHWPKLHDRHTFLQGGVVRAAVTDIQVVSNGFLTCGGDGSVKLVQFQDIPLE